MWFVISSSKISRSKIPFVVLRRDNWDDYGYKTTFSATLHLPTDETLKLGYVKILKFDQTHGPTPMPDEPFERLGPDYCSVGADSAYYEELFKRGESIYRPYLEGISDAAYSDETRARFEDLEGYRVSLLRFSGGEHTIADAARLFASPTPTTRRKRKGFVVRFKTTLATEANAFVIDFDFTRRGGLPHRMNVLIGYNGTGKTRLLSNLAIAASGYGYGSKEAQFEKRAGRFVGTAPPFKTVVVVSYSAFDTFVIPGKNKVERARLREEGGIFGYVYCGLRERTEADAAGIRQHRAAYRLKTPEETEKEFLAAVRRVREGNRLEALVQILGPLLRDASFQRIGLTSLYSESEDQDKNLTSLFRRLSSGHKVVLKMVTELTAHVDESQPTLVLIDEPETHLHPPLLAAFLKSIRECLERFDAYAVLSTHSPVVLQETPSHYVRVLRRAGDLSKVETPSTETFGENIGVITSDVFNLDDGSTDWHGTLRSLARRKTLRQIEKLFANRLGFGAKSYIISRREEGGEA